MAAHVRGASVAVDAELAPAAPAAPPRPFHAARQLLQRAGGPRRGRARAASGGGALPRGKKNPHAEGLITAVEGARLEHLMCFVGNTKMQEELKAMEQIINRQANDVHEINAARCSEVISLSREVAALRAKLLGDDMAAGGDLLACSGPRAVRHLGWGSQAEEVAALQEELVRQERLFQEATRDVLEAEREAAILEARLAVAQEVHKQEMRELGEAENVGPIHSSGRAASSGSTEQCEGFAELRRVCEQLRHTGDRLLSTLQPLAVVPPSDLAAWLRAFGAGLDAAAAAPGLGGQGAEHKEHQARLH